MDYEDEYIIEKAHKFLSTKDNIHKNYEEYWVTEKEFMEIVLNQFIEFVKLSAE